MKRVAWLAFALGCLVAIAALSPGLAASALGQRQSVSRPSRHVITYTAWDGHRRSAILLLPCWYKRGCARRLPLVISPHGRGMSPAWVAARWGLLPTRDGFAVICPAGEGERLPNYSCGAPGQISDLARMPEIVQHALKWVHIDRRCVYAVGPSMGGQEALLLAARYPDRIAAAASIDGLADLAAHFYQMPCPKGSGRRVLAEMTVECGGTPAQQPSSYAQRSPLSYAQDLALDGVPLGLWWSRRDRVVVDQDSRQSGLLYRTIRRLNPAAPIREIVSDYRHCGAFCANIALRRVVAFLRPRGRWRTVSVSAPPDWCLSSAAPSATLWGYRFRAEGTVRGVWSVHVRAGQTTFFDSSTPVLVSLPCCASRRFVRVVSGGITRRGAVRDGFLRLVLPAGRTCLIVDRGGSPVL